jgi:predicted  nucleic acid-binding Zn-ribbon protein
MPAHFMHKNLDRYLMKQENQKALESNIEWKLNRMREEYNALSKAYLAIQLENFKLQRQVTELQTEVDLYEHNS